MLFTQLFAQPIFNLYNFNFGFLVIVHFELRLDFGSDYGSIGFSFIYNFIVTGLISALGCISCGIKMQRLSVSKRLNLFRLLNGMSHFCTGYFL